MPELDYVKLLYLLANATSKLQLIDQGVISSL